MKCYESGFHFVGLSVGAVSSVLTKGINERYNDGTRGVGKGN